jgi:hypothetical protein
MSAMADLPPYSLVLLGFPPEAEMIENSALLLDRVLGRGDITIETAFSPSNTARLWAAYAERRPVYLAFVYEPGENVKVGIRGVSQKSRTENLALAASYGIGRICPGPRETVGPWPFKVLRVYPSLPPILTIRFGYGWEVDRVIPPSTSYSACEPVLYSDR